MSTKNNDELVQKLMELVKKKKEEIKKAEKPDWKTNCSFKFNPAVAQSINIQVETDVDNLIGILSFLSVQNSHHNEIAKELEVESKFKWGGSTYEEWKSDIKSRIGKIMISKKKAELDMLESRLDKLISPELKTKLELEEITKLLDQ